MRSEEISGKLIEKKKKEYVLSKNWLLKGWQGNNLNNFDEL